MSIKRRLSVAVFPLLLIAACDSSRDADSSAPAVVSGDTGREQVRAMTGSAEQSAGLLEEGMVNPGYEEKPEWFANSFMDIREDITEAAASGKRVLLYFYQDGCPYCKKLLDTNFSQKAIETNTREHFEVIAINMWGDREVTGFNGGLTTEKQFADAMRVMFTPTLLFLDEQGNVVLRINGYYPPHKFNAALDYSATHDGSAPSFREFLATTEPVPASGELHREPGYLSSDVALDTRTGGKPLLVMFEQKQCAPCDELHLDILKQSESVAQLEHFDVLLLDMWSMDTVIRPDGKTGSVTNWARDLNVQYAPSLVFFDAEGREVFRTETWLRSFHIQSALNYVATKAYIEQPSFQRFMGSRAKALEAQGIHIDLLE